MGRVLLLLAILLLTLPPAAAREPASTVFVRMSPDHLRQAREAGLEPVRLVDYGSFAWLELAEGDLLLLQAGGLPYEVQPDPYRLDLGGQSFDPVRDGVRLPAGWQPAAERDDAAAEGHDLQLVQLIGPTRAEWLSALEAAGLELVRYVHPYSYIAWGDAAALERAAGHDFVRWTGPFEPAWRLDPRWRILGAEPVPLNVLLVRAADVEEAVNRLASLGGDPGARVALDRALSHVSLRLPAPALQAAARIPGVYSVQVAPTDGGLRGEMSNQVSANNLNSNFAFAGYQEWLADLGLDGTGVVIANVDAGIRGTHQDLVGRMLPCSGSTCGGALMSDHGTHTAGIMAADGSSGIADSGGFLRGLGMAPGARLIEQVYTLAYQGDSPNMGLLMAESYRNGAVISGNSWGPSGTPEGYDFYAMQVDIGVRDADPVAPGNQPLTYVLSIMNGGGGVSTQGSPDEAKNILTIGSTYLQHIDGSQLLNFDDLSYNTAHGPALDGRKIPHMVAPGFFVDSTSSNGDDQFVLKSGTSMASPHVSGAAALFVQYYRARRATDPSPALIKAAFLAVARDLAGHLDADGNVLGHPFDSKQGWGRLDAAAVLNPAVPVRYYDQLTVLDDTGQVWQRVLRVGDSNRPLRLMLAWTDAPGHGEGGITPAWNNDLDLVVEAGGKTYRGNAFGSDGWSLAGGGRDAMNNTEGVFLPPGAATTFTVRVVASNIPSDGVPNHGDDTDQDFALVCYNCLPGGSDRLLYLPLIRN
ncbi:MAG: S8 family serine peptidase [Anaerolineae bacterium]|nr:S8 family serine peptidase [Anaerolineae bacterium]